jgi:hypothetical protein
MLLKNLCVEKKLKQLVLVWLQAGHSFPINLSLSLGGSLLSYIYSAPPLKVCSDIESVTQSHCWPKSVIYFFWLILQLSVVGAWFDGLVDHPMSSSELKVSWLLARMWWNFKSVVMVCSWSKVVGLATMLLGPAISLCLGNPSIHTCTQYPNSAELLQLIRFLNNIIQETAWIAET